MQDQQQALSLRVQNFTDAICRDLNLAAAREADDPLAMENAVAASLKKLADEFGTSDYGFNLSIEQYVERFYALVKDLLPGILAQHLPRHAALVSISDDMNIAFVAYYALSLIYKKEDSKDKLKSLTGEKYTFFTQFYPLAFEVRSRYYKRIREYEEALDSDEMAIESLEARGIENYALGISYAATVCRMYEMGYAVELSQRDCAKRYIRAALDYKPDYPKYHFLRGKLLFYSNRGTQDPDRFNAICDEALACVEKACKLQAERSGAHAQKTWKEFKDLKAKIIQERRNRVDQGLPFRHFSERELRENVERILQCADANAVASQSLQPPNPNLKTGQKFVFISYSHRDFQSVYCDLLALYANKVPFQYDGDLPMGTRWDSEVHDFINKEECVGVIFFVSQNTILSKSIAKECRLMLEAQKSGKRYFSVNLEGRMPPSEILMNSFRTHSSEECRNAQVDSERMVGFLNTFHDDITFVPKLPENEPQGSAHIPELIKAIRKTFPALEIGERNAAPVSV